MNLLASFLMTSLLAVQAPGVQQPAPTAPPRPTEPRATVAPEGYVIGPQDQLSITVYDEQDLTNKYRVDDAAPPWCRG